MPAVGNALQWTEEQGEETDEAAAEDAQKTPGRRSQQLDPVVRRAPHFLIAEAVLAIMLQSSPCMPCNSSSFKPS